MLQSTSYLEFQFTHPVWGATEARDVGIYNMPVSIHAPRVGCDSQRVDSGRSLGVSIHAPRVGCDRWTPPSKPSIISFQFTHPVWGATGTKFRVTKVTRVSIHAPRVGCDYSPDLNWGASTLFQFTHPVWGATASQQPTANRHDSFNSRTPCGVRQFVLDGYAWVPSFNSRTPCGVRQTEPKNGFCQFSVSIHAPRVGCDTQGRESTAPATSFNSRTPCGVRLLRPFVLGLLIMFQFTHPVWGAT